MMPLTVQTICAAVGGTVLQSSGAAVRDVTTDSRRVPQEALFIPLVGERFDGHAYIEKALEAGAAGCLTAKTPEALLPGKFYIQVPDTRLALKALAAWYRGQFRLPVVQVTGSVGKTTTKEMIAAVLTQKYETLRTEGNLNNDIGAPLTLLRLMPEHEAAVIETGMNHFGEIRYLGEMVRPDIAVITNVGDAHIENLGNTRQGILQAKCEIFENLTPEGVAVLNGDDELLNTVTLPQIILRCGEGEHCDVRVTDIDDRGLRGGGALVCRGSALRRPGAGGRGLYRDNGTGGLSAGDGGAGAAHGLSHGHGGSHRRTAGPDGGGDRRGDGGLCTGREPDAPDPYGRGSAGHRRLLQRQSAVHGGGHPYAGRQPAEKAPGGAGRHG